MLMPQQPCFLLSVVITSRYKSFPQNTHQLLEKIVRDPKLMQRLPERVEAFQLFDLVAGEAEYLQIGQTGQVCYLFNVVGRQREVPAG